jgi:hypothetical protein
LGTDRFLAELQLQADTSAKAENERAERLVREGLRELGCAATAFALCSLLLKPVAANPDAKTAAADHRNQASTRIMTTASAVTARASTVGVRFDTQRQEFRLISRKERAPFLNGALS